MKTPAESSVHSESAVEQLQLHRLISAPPERVFKAWTDPDELTSWWGPKDVICRSAEVDLRIGGQYRIANEFPDGTVVWISGEFERIERPNLLRYSWFVESADAAPERVTVLFDAEECGTKVTVIHEQIATKFLREQHHRGWAVCMDGLLDYIAAT